MRATFLGWLVRATSCGVAALTLIAILAPISPFADELPALGQEQKQAKSDRCKFMMDKVNSIILSLNAKGEITFLNHYGQQFFGYPNKEILGKPMLGILTPSAGFKGRDLAAFLTGLVREPNRYAYSVNVNMLRNGERVWIFWANKGIYDDQGQVLEVLRVGVDITGENAVSRLRPRNLGISAICCRAGLGSSAGNLKTSPAVSRRSARSWNGPGSKPNQVSWRAWRPLTINRWRGLPRS